MPRLPDKHSNVAVALPNDVIEGIKRLAKKHERPFMVEVAHALRRHLDAPPKIVVIRQEEPSPLADAEVKVEKKEEKTTAKKKTKK